MRSYINWGGDRNTLCKGLKTSPYGCVLKTSRVSLEGKAQIEQYLLAVGLDGYKNNQIRENKQ